MQVGVKISVPGLSFGAATHVVGGTGQCVGGGMASGPGAGGRSRASEP